MDIRTIRKLMELLEESTISKLEIKEGELEIKISKTMAGQAVVASPMPATTPIIEAKSNLASPSNTEGAEAVADEGEKVTSPMVGTFYGSASPDSPPFVKIGSKVKVGDTLCILEAMKIMNSIESEIEGVVKQILVKDGSPVQYGQLLFIIE